jgi:hypothetical protein
MSSSVKDLKITYQDFVIRGGPWWLRPIMLATLEAKIRTQFEASQGKKLERSSQPLSEC